MGGRTTPIPRTGRNTVHAFSKNAMNGTVRCVMKLKPAKRWRATHELTCCPFIRFYSVKRDSGYSSIEKRPTELEMIKRLDVPTELGEMTSDFDDIVRIASLSDSDKAITKLVIPLIKQTSSSHRSTTFPFSTIEGAVFWFRNSFSGARKHFNRVMFHPSRDWLISLGACVGDASLDPYLNDFRNYASALSLVLQGIMKCTLQGLAGAVESHKSFIESYSHSLSMSREGTDFARGYLVMVHAVVLGCLGDFRVLNTSSPMASIVEMYSGFRDFASSAPPPRTITFKAKLTGATYFMDPWTLTPDSAPFKSSQTHVSSSENTMTVNVTYGQSPVYVCVGMVNFLSSSSTEMHVTSGSSIDMLSVDGNSCAVACDGVLDGEASAEGWVDSWSSSGFVHMPEGWCACAGVSYSTQWSLRHTTHPSASVTATPATSTFSPEMVEFIQTYFASIGVLIESICHYERTVNGRCALEWSQLVAQNGSVIRALRRFPDSVRSNAQNKLKRKFDALDTLFLKCMESLHNQASSLSIPSDVCGVSRPMFTATTDGMPPSPPHLEICATTTMA